MCVCELEEPSGKPVVDFDANDTINTINNTQQSILAS